MASNQRDAMLVQRLQSAAHDLAQNLRIDAFLRKACYGHRRDWRARHRPNVVDRVERSNAAIVVWVVNDWSKEIERLHKRKVVSKTVNSRVVGCIKTDNQIWIGGLFG